MKSKFSFSSSITNQIHFVRQLETELNGFMKSVMRTYTNTKRRKRVKKKKVKSTTKPRKKVRRNTFKNIRYHFHQKSMENFIMTFSGKYLIEMW